MHHHLNIVDRYPYGVVHTLDAARPLLVYLKHLLLNAVSDSRNLSGRGGVTDYEVVADCTLKAGEVERYDILTFLVGNCRYDCFYQVLFHLFFYCLFLFLFSCSSCALCAGAKNIQRYNIWLVFPNFPLRYLLYIQISLHYSAFTAGAVERITSRKALTIELLA